MANPDLLNSIPVRSSSATLCKKKSLNQTKFPGVKAALARHKAFDATDTKTSPHMEQPPDTHDHRVSTSGPWRTALLFCGLLCTALAVAGILLPLLPTTPFLLLAAACFARSSPKLHRWLHTNRFFGHYLERYRRGEGLPFIAKASILGLLWLSLSASALWAVPDAAWHLHAGLLVVGLSVSFFVLRIKTSSPTKASA